MANIKQLEQEVRDSKAKANNLIVLLDMCTVGGNDKEAGAAMLALCRCMPPSPSATLASFSQHNHSHRKT